MIERRQQHRRQIHRNLVAADEEEQRIGHRCRKCCEKQRNVAIAGDDTERHGQGSHSGSLEQQRRGDLEPEVSRESGNERGDQPCRVVAHRGPDRRHKAHDDDRHQKGGDPVDDGQPIGGRIAPDKPPDQKGSARSQCDDAEQPRSGDRDRA